MVVCYMEEAHLAMMSIEYICKEFMAFGGLDLTTLDGLCSSCYSNNCAVSFVDTLAAI